MNTPQLLNELRFKTSRSSGSGGQHVNKVATKVLLMFDLEASTGLTDEQKTKLKERLVKRLSANGQLQMQCGETRSQFRNKRIVISRFLQLLRQALTEQPERKASKIPKAVIAKRKEAKRRQSQKKANRRPPEI